MRKPIDDNKLGWGFIIAMFAILTYSCSAGWLQSEPGDPEDCYTPYGCVGP